MAARRRKEFGEYIVSDPEICGGELTFEGTRILVKGVLYYAAFATAGTKTIARHAGTSLVNPRLGRLIETGLTAATLPATATFAAAAADALIPILRLTFAY